MPPVCISVSVICAFLVPTSFVDVLDAFMQRDFEGKWIIQPAVVAQEPGGAAPSLSSGSHATVVTHQLSVMPMISIPGPMGGMMQVRQLVEHVPRSFHHAVVSTTDSQARLAPCNLALCL